MDAQQSGADRDSVTGKKESSPPEGAPPGLWGKYRAEILLGLLVLYVLLLAVGTVAELFDIRWILDLPIY